MVAGGAERTRATMTFHDRRILLMVSANH
jgi:hypothetical protein